LNPRGLDTLFGCNLDIFLNTFSNRKIFMRTDSCSNGGRELKVIELRKILQENRDIIRTEKISDDCLISFIICWANEEDYSKKKNRVVAPVVIK